MHSINEVLRFFLRIITYVQCLFYENLWMASKPYLHQTKIALGYCHNFVKYVPFLIFLA
jgi:hypothetical protein